MKSLYINMEGVPTMHVITISVNHKLYEADLIFVELFEVV
jgi:hypothetical protein